MEFRRTYFDPAAEGETSEDGSTVTFSCDDSVYVYNDDIVLAVNLAMATRRPLLVAGAPGSGKSTLAQNVSKVLQRKYYHRVITSRTRAQDLQWRFDALRRLSDAQRQGVDLPPRAAYVEPEILWWAFDPANAASFGHEDPAEATAATDAVVLLDEIDKAEPDVPNDLLDPLDLQRFDVRDLDEPMVVQARHDVLLIMTTNGEREMPPAFLRRCVVLELENPESPWLVAIADRRFGGANHDFHASVAAEMEFLQKAARHAGLREPSTAEYLDALRACQDLGVDTGSQAWDRVRVALLWKQDESKLPESVRRPQRIFLGDLIRAVGLLDVADPAVVRRMAGMLGLDRLIPQPGATTRGASATRLRPVERESPPPAPRPSASPAVATPGLGRPVAASLDVIASGRLPAAPPAWAAETVAMPAPGGRRDRRVDTLLTPRRTRATLGAALAQWTPDGEYDVARLLDEVIGLRPVTELPRESVPTLRLGAQVLVDISAGMLPYRADCHHVVTRCRQLVPPSLLDVRSFAGAPGRVGAGPRNTWISWTAPPHGTPVLVLTTLGLGGPLVDRDRATPGAWLAFADAAHRAGCPVIVLVPFGREYWTPRLAAAMTLVHWDRDTTVAAVRRATRPAVGKR